MSENVWTEGEYDEIDEVCEREFSFDPALMSGKELADFVIMRKTSFSQEIQDRALTF